MGLCLSLESLLFSIYCNIWYHLYKHYREWIYYLSAIYPIGPSSCNFSDSNVNFFCGFPARIKLPLFFYFSSFVVFIVLVLIQFVNIFSDYFSFFYLFSVLSTRVIHIKHKNFKTYCSYALKPFNFNNITV